MKQGYDFFRTAGLSRDLYLYVWQATRTTQLLICLLSIILAPLMMVPLEIQRRIVDEALPGKNVLLLSGLGCAYLVLIFVQGGLKYWLNMTKGRAVEIIARKIRLAVLVWTASAEPAAAGDSDSGTVVSIVAAEAEDVSGFGGEALSLPLLAGGTILYVAGYLLWVEPAIAVLALVIYFPQAVIVPLTQHTINRLARLRIRSVRRLGLLMTQSDKPRGGRVLIDRIFKIRIMIYVRKFLLAALGNFLDSLGAVLVLMIGGYLVIKGQTTVGTLVVFMSGLGKIADPWDQLINYYRSVSNTAVIYEMIRIKLDGGREPRR